MVKAACEAATITAGGTSLVHRTKNPTTPRSSWTEVFRLQERYHEIAEARTYYDRIADFGDQDLRTEGGLHGFLRRLEKIQSGIQGNTVLEVGAGAGRFSIAFKKRGLDVVATDISPEMLKKLHQLCPDIPTIVSDAHHLPFKKGVFDAVFSCDVLEHLPHPEEAVKEQARVCKEKGTVQAIVPNKLCPYYWRNILRERYWWHYNTSPIHHRRSSGELASIFMSQGFTLYQLDTFLLVPARARGRVFTVLCSMEKFAERVVSIRLFLGLNYVRAGPPRHADDQAEQFHSRSFLFRG